MNGFINHNGVLVEADQPVIRAGNRNFQYGEGVFETMRYNGGIFQRDSHFKRLFSGLKELQINVPPEFSEELLSREISKLIAVNKHPSARVRLTVFRGSSGSAGEFRASRTEPASTLPGWIIETWPIQPGFEFNSTGISLTVYENARKPQDGLAGFKTCNYLPYAMAAIYARDNGWDDALVLNTSGNVCDSSIANVFIIKDRIIYTPPLSEGCIAGVMRNFLLIKLPESAVRIKEMPLTLEDMMNADEIFLSNVIRGILPVSRFNNKRYPVRMAKEIFNIVQSA